MPTFSLQTSGLSFAHDANQSWQFEDIKLAKGDHLLILGNSGSGKTTLLHLLSGLLTPESGEILIDGQNIVTLKKKHKDEVRGSKVGMVFQRPHFIRSLNVMDNVLMASKLGNSIPLNKSDVLTILQHLDIEQLAHKNIQQLSEGEKQRVGIARALANNPTIILADEPTSALDDNNCEAVIQLLIENSKASGSALIVVTHDERVKRHFSNQIII